MRALRVVGVTEDGAVVLEDPGRRERYTVPADEQLRAAARSRTKKGKPVMPSWDEVLLGVRGQR